MIYSTVTDLARLRGQSTYQTTKSVLHNIKQLTMNECKTCSARPHILLKTVTNS